MILEYSEFQVIQQEVKDTLKFLSDKLIQIKYLGMEPKLLKEALIEVAGYRLAIDTWEQDDNSYEAQTNYLSDGHIRAIYSRTLILKNIKRYVQV